MRRPLGAGDVRNVPDQGAEEPLGNVRAEAAAGAPPAVLAAWAEVWEKVDRAVGRAEALNLDRRQVVLGVFRDLAEAAKRG